MTDERDSNLHEQENERDREEEQNLIIILCKSAQLHWQNDIYVKHCFDSSNSYEKWCIKSELIKAKTSKGIQSTKELIIW